jgi:hypothetical protein
MMTTPVRHDVEPIIEFPPLDDGPRWSGFLNAERIQRTAPRRDRPASATGHR